MKKIVVFLAVICVTWFVACQDESNQKPKAEDESCIKPIKDPNEVKPMALMMRAMANNCDSMRLLLNKGETVDSNRYPIMPFWTAEPTDSSVLEELFFNNAKSFEAAYRTLMSSQENQKEHYTAVINQCVNCHSSYCSGPLKRIRTLTLDYKKEE